MNEEEEVLVEVSSWWCRGGGDDRVLLESLRWGGGCSGFCYRYLILSYLSEDSGATRHTVLAPATEPVAAAAEPVEGPSTPPPSPPPPSLAAVAASASAGSGRRQCASAWARSSGPMSAQPVRSKARSEGHACSAAAAAAGWST